MSKEFSFRAPTLFDPSATASENSLIGLHDAPSAAEAGAKTERLARWLKSKFSESGLAAKGPSLDEGGWTIDVASTAEGFVLCVLGGNLEEPPTFELLVTKIGGADEGPVVDAIERILRTAGEIKDLTIS